MSTAHNADVHAQTALQQSTCGTACNAGIHAQTALQHLVVQQSNLPPPKKDECPFLLIFCVDNSKSMGIHDVKSGSGSMSRAAAVTKLCRELLEQQQRDSDTVSWLSCSFFLFDDQVRTIFSKVPVANATGLLNEPSPKHGTNYSRACKAVEDLTTSTEACNPGQAQFHVVFLSDGRPGEMPGGPEAFDGRETVRCDKCEIPAAPAIIGRLAGRLRARLTFHAIAIGKEDPCWLRHLVSIARTAGASATFMQPEQLDMRLSVVSRPPMVTVSDRCANASRTAPVDLDDRLRPAASMPPSVMPPPPLMPPVATLMPPPSSTMPPPAAPQRTSTLADAFSHISSSLTSSFGGQGGKPHVTCPAEYEDRNAYQNAKDGWQSLSAAHRMLLQRGSLTIAQHSWEPMPMIRIRCKPFAHGGQRNAFHLLLLNNTHKVAKESRYYERFEERLNLHQISMLESITARDYAAEFNATVREPSRNVRKRVDHDLPRSQPFRPDIEVLELEIYRVAAPELPVRP